MRVVIPILMAMLLLVSCQVKPYAPPPQKAYVENVEVHVREFAGRPEVYARVKGRLTTNAAQIVDSPQRRENGAIYLDVMEQTPRGADLLTNLTELPSFERIIPVDILGLTPGVYLMNVNGLETTFEIPLLQAETIASGEVPVSRHLRDEMIDIEDAILVDPVPQNP
ncbi:MAG: hypothetical protein AAGF67_10100 [Verrucomicrobiota bacterium]